MDLGLHPPCQSFMTKEQLEQPETLYRLHVAVSGSCFLAQTGVIVPPERIFEGYACFSSYSTTWLGPCRAAYRHDDRPL